ncbi:hypothetical protein IFM46972_07554 [Aspergillus udagawae]|uniref:Uncharacterized protein n=1 Tax=Aspergillus udagawae TaxID=91492 RepID=A0A8H3P574_9EURO|nr:hypothetical protein IFM46972_07554 [Aspergillus udagawae]
MPSQRPSFGAYMTLSTRSLLCKFSFIYNYRRERSENNTKIRSGICAAGGPIAYYLFCYYYQGLDKATSRRRCSDATIILGAYLLKYVLQYFALRSRRAPERWIGGKK